ncbi:MAG TPA: trigger factor [Solirubrobacteraceae bacterium]|nr:trigger factor [Solirubrobacteraceae bacterium]
MSAALETTVTELSDSRVRVQVQVAPEEVEGRLARKARQLGRELKLPGFRRGKVPAPLVLQRVGREAVLDQAVRDSLSGWYAQAIETAGVVPVGDPQLDLADLPGEGEALQFSIEIGVLPKATLGSYEGLEVPRREPAVEEQQVDREIEAMRERLARLETAERAAAEGDFVVIDYVGSLPAGEADAQTDEQALEPFGAPPPEAVVGEGRDQLVELGGGNLIPGFEEGLIGAGAGERRDVKLTFPVDYGNEELAGREAVFAIDVKEVKRKELPAIDDDLAVDAGFDDLAELREDIRRRLTEADEERIEVEFREAALDAAVAQAEVPLTGELIEARAKEMWERMLHSLSHRGISREAYLQISGREEGEMLAEMQDDAERALRREAVLTAIVAAEGIVPSAERLLEAVTPTAEREGIEPAKLIEDLRSNGRLEELREDLAARIAIELIAERAKPISQAQAQAREQLWTPGAESAAPAGAGGAAGVGGQGPAPGKLWTPTDPPAGS